jgi:capsular exopolysaccharide synthesis family protein
VDIGLDSVSSNTKVLERAPIPGSPFTPNIKKSTMTGAGIGFLIGILLLVGRELFDRTFKNQIQVEERLQLPVLGILPLLSTGKFRKKLDEMTAERQYQLNSKSNFSEVVNHIRTGIIYSNFDNPPKVILITSPLPKEGKTTTATNLSLAFSKLGRTLLIDADFRKPRIAQIANVSNKKGLTGYVAGQNSLQECLSKDADSKNLFFMRSGEVPPNPLEMISSNRFKDILDLMRKNFDYIIIDSAPIIPVSDGIVLGKLADAILLVLKAGSTSHHITDTAMKRFRSANLKPTGVILAQLDYKSSHYYYGRYNYYYSKEYYG